MINFDQTKFACDRCQRGHRNASCEHLDRVMVEVRAVGRPAADSNRFGILGKVRESRRVEVHVSSGTVFLFSATDEPLEFMRARLVDVPGAATVVVQRSKPRKFGDDAGFEERIPATLAKIQYHIETADSPMPANRASTSDTSIDLPRSHSDQACSPAFDPSPSPSTIQFGPLSTHLGSPVSASLAFSPPNILATSPVEEHDVDVVMGFFSAAAASPPHEA
ncbi:hypothetical protein BDK51DRAFT_34305 [Blyttiomyces helicus]|uniref:Copper-fist domain-containing protein n=1 Tax=Blyttiomyces helicus TaxID=388810 RepID=A0A4P9VUH8_9FUNG|nr:hypothetical protein BDK51DRAFT_34305 [Blyttiomyces helicus]|eukprot:RKO82742.1 hypothetical protein BDK51DRAFT_34305 [Blyttiomyces helicus]